ncbi:MAG TPA: isopentenyl-diphosphate Delta-isomerase, partial [Acidimicrobiales bacterium]|nr:isopentenyl-diphosphate Delta-isomerase [Acidimicrobiales bacterium]
MTDPAPPTLDPSPRRHGALRVPRSALPAARSPATGGAVTEPVVLLDPAGRPSGTLPKDAVHHERTPLHLAFSCHVVAPDGRVLLTRRAAVKQTRPSTWSNACCGHPRPGETLRRAVERRLADELGLAPRRMALAIPDFAYRAAMEGGPVEHELCPVVVAEVDAEPVPDPAEVEAVAWTTWDELRVRAAAEPGSLSPW